MAFGSFNALAKIGPQTIDLWSQLLSTVPRSRLVLKSRGSGSTEVSQRLRSAFAAHGIDPQRIDLRPPLNSPRDHLASYNDIDVALDTFPYAGTTTTCEALWMGVPVVTLAGQLHMSRVGVSLLASAGLEEFVATDSQQYIQIAAELASDVDRRARLRRDLRDLLLASPLMNAPQFTRDFESALRQMWQHYCQTPAL